MDRRRARSSSSETLLDSVREPSASKARHSRPTRSPTSRRLVGAMLNATELAFAVARHHHHATADIWSRESIGSLCGFVSIGSVHLSQAFADRSTALGSSSSAQVEGGRVNLTPAAAGARELPPEVWRGPQRTFRASQHGLVVLSDSAVDLARRRLHWLRRRGTPAPHFHCPGCAARRQTWLTSTALALYFACGSWRWRND